MPDQAAQTANIWQDPNLMSIMLGMIGQAAMGEHQQTWQSQLGGAATALGRSRKTALAAEEMGKKGEERESWWRDLFRSMYGGGEAEPEAGMEGLGLSSTMLSAEGKPYPGIEQRRVEREEPNFLETYLGGYRFD